MPSWMVKSLSSSPHLCARDRGGSSHPSPGDGLDYPGHPEQAVLIQSLSQGGCQAAAGQRGEVAAGPEVREQHGRGAVPGAAAAVSRPEDRQTDTEWVGGKMRGETAQKHKAETLYDIMHSCIYYCQDQTAIRPRCNFHTRPEWHKPQICAETTSNYDSKSTAQLVSLMSLPITQCKQPVIKIKQ